MSNSYIEKTPYNNCCKILSIISISAIVISLIIYAVYKNITNMKDDF